MHVRILDSDSVLISAMMHAPGSRKEAKDKMTDTIDKKELILKIIPLKKNIEECAEEVDGPHWRSYKSSYYRGYLDAVSDILNKIYE